MKTNYLLIFLVIYFLFLIQLTITILFGLFMLNII